MKLGAMTIVYNEEKLIRGCLDTLAPYVDKYVVAISDNPYYGKKEPRDRTEDICKEYGCEVYVDDWRQEHDQRNFCVEKLQDCDWIITTDADMWMTEDYRDALFEYLEVANKDLIFTRNDTYFKDVNHRIVGDDFCPVIAFRPHLRFYSVASINAPSLTFEKPITHINWCEPKDILKKVTTYAHACEYDGAKWYKDYFINWEDKEECLMPDGKRFKVEKVDFPEELKKYL